VIDDFFHLPPVSTTPVVHLELRISPKKQKIWNGSNGILSGLGELIHEKYLKSKISWHCPFNRVTNKTWLQPSPPPPGVIHQTVAGRWQPSQLVGGGDVSNKTKRLKRLRHENFYFGISSWIISLRAAYWFLWHHFQKFAAQGAPPVPTTAVFTSIG
jgi:hypothetical protein